MIIFLLLLACAVTAVAAFQSKNERTLMTLSVTGSTVVAVLASVIAIPILLGRDPASLGATWHVDPFAALLMLLVGIVQWTATQVSVGYIGNELHAEMISFKQARQYFSLIMLFMFSMFLTLVANNPGLTWVALEATTLTTTALVAFYTHEGSLEAAWKYIVICSLGISVGLFGVIMVFYAATQAGLHPQTLTWSALHAAAGSLSPSLMRKAFIFIFIGFGTKIGLVPMHTWLPDAHGRTPSPVSALLSGVLLNIALFATLRYKALVDISAGDPSWSNQLFLMFGAISFIVPAAFILVQQNYKRLLAYSSIEHMGFITFAFGLGPVGNLAAVIHLVGHSLTKSLLFFGAGNVLQRFHTTKMEKVSQVATYLPYTGALFILGLLVLLAIPPSPLFMSEYLAFSASVRTHFFLTAFMLLAGTMILAGMIRQFGTMLYGKRPDTEPKNIKTERWGWSQTLMTLHLVAVLSLGASLLHPSVRAFFERLAASIQ